MAETASERSYGKRYLRYLRGLPAHPERAFGAETKRWKFREGDEVFTATRRAHEKVWRVIFELDDGGTFLRNGEGDQGNLMCISPEDPRGSLMIRNSGVISIDGNKFSEREVLFYEPDGTLNSISVEFQRIKRGHPGSIFGTVPHDLIDLVRRTASPQTVSCQTAHMDGREFKLGLGVASQKNHADVRLERGAEGFVSHTVPLHLEGPKDAIGCLRQRINLEAGQTLM